MEKRYYNMIRDGLAYARRRAGMTQETLAERLGISVRSLISYEKGEKTLPALVAGQWADLCQVHLLAVFVFDMSSQGRPPYNIKIEWTAEQLGRALHLCRKVSGKVNNARVTQQYVADRMETHRITISNWEKAASSPNLIQLTRFGEVCGAEVAVQLAQKDGNGFENFSSQSQCVSAALSVNL